MRIVMKYQVGDGCTYSCDVVKPIEYVSVEQARLDFGSKILEVQEKIQKYQKDYSQWENRYNSLSSSEKKMEAWKDRPESPSSVFHFGGRSFEYGTFFESSYNEKKDKYDETYVEPTFITVDEWFK